MFSIKQVSMSGDSRPPVSFHSNVGDNIEMQNRGLTATRRDINDVTHTKVFSSRPLEPGEIFTVRMESSRCNNSVGGK